MVTGTGLSHPPTRFIEPAYVRDRGSQLVQLIGEEGAAVAPVPAVAAEDLRSMYEWMVRLRSFDTRLVSLQRQGRITFFVTASGEEASIIGTGFALRPDDWVFPAYREHGVAMYRGYPMEALLCQIIGNSGDYLKGRQMPNHFGSPRYRFMAASSPVGTQIPQAVGSAWSSRLRREDNVSVVYFGDGATSTGDFHAGMNFAAVQQLPVVFFCKNNGWAISLPGAKQTRVECLADKAVAYGMPGVRVDGNDVVAVYQVAAEAIAWARSGSGPVFVELVTHRMGGHSTSDDPSRYRDPELIEPWKKKDPIQRFRRYLQARHLWSDADEQRAWAEADARITEALKEVEPLPPPPLESLCEDVYAEMPWHLREQLDQLQGRSD
jgi:2-oxoisovalerate dehydrogenase E1 component alpha subunit